MSNILPFRSKHQSDKLAQSIINRNIDDRFREAIVADRGIDKALKGKTPAEQITLIAAIGAMFGWEDISLEKDA